MTTRREFLAGAGVAAALGTTAVAQGSDDGNAFQHVAESVRADDEYAWSWHCNIAMAAKDEGVDHETAQKIAARFMGWAFEVNTLQHCSRFL